MTVKIAETSKRVEIFKEEEEGKSVDDVKSLTIPKRNITPQFVAFVYFVITISTNMAYTLNNASRGIDITDSFKENIVFAFIVLLPIELIIFPLYAIVYTFYKNRQLLKYNKDSKRMVKKYKWGSIQSVIGVLLVIITGNLVFLISIFSMRIFETF